MKKGTKRTYTKEFKQEAVQRWIFSCLSPIVSSGRNLPGDCDPCPRWQGYFRLAIIGPHPRRKRSDSRGW